MRKKRKIGLPPGTLVYTGIKGNLPVEVNYLEYGVDHFKEERKKKSKEINLHISDESKVQWYDVRGLHNVDLIQEIGKIFKMHPIVAEDIVDVHQRPKYTEYNDGHFISLKALSFDSEIGCIVSQTISIYFGIGFVLTFQEHEDDIFSGLRTRIKEGKGRIRTNGADYLAYAIVDLLVDRYFSVLDNIDEKIEEVEEAISLKSEIIDKSEIFELKKALSKFRKNIAPLREAINQFSRSDTELVTESTKIFIRDVYSHTVQIMDSIDNHRDILSSLQDLYLSELSMKMNKIMQVLTIITSIFVPLSFLTGLYGMNFENMPELKSQYGYFILLSVMLVAVFFMMAFFRKKRWL